MNKELKERLESIDFKLKNKIHSIKVELNDIKIEQLKNKIRDGKC